MQKDIALLKVEGLTKYYRGLAANENIDLQITEGQIVGLIGPNGAGKSTLFKMISGFNSADRGKIFFEGREIQNKEPYKISRQGIASTFQHAQMFPNLQLLEAVMAGAYGNGKNKSERAGSRWKKSGLSGWRARKPLVSSKLNMFERKKAELAAALATEPKLILLDELFAGLVPSEVPLMIEQVRRVRESGVSVFIVEHVLRAIMEMCDYVYVLESGKLIAEGTPEEIRHNPLVITAYLGDDYDA